MHVFLFNGSTCILVYQGGMLSGSKRVYAFLLSKITFILAQQEYTYPCSTQIHVTFFNKNTHIFLNMAR